jgi:type I restriction enzyme S subunit
MRVKLDKVCKRIYAGGDVPKDRYSTVKTAEYAIPIYANAEKDNGLYGYTDTARENELSITVAARGTIGFTAIRREPFLPVVRLITVVPDLSTVSERYLYYALRNCKPASSGTSIPQLTVPDIKKNEIELYSLSVQETIADKLDAVGRVIELRQQQLQKLDDLVKARFIELFGMPGTDAFGWGLVPLGSTCNINPKKSLDSRLVSGAVVSFVPMPAVTEHGEIDATAIKEYDEVKTGFTYFAENDVLFAKITPCMENGKGAVAKGLHNGIGFGSTEFHVLRPISGKTDPYWIYTLTAFSQFRMDAASNMTGSAGQRRVPASFLENYRVSLPPIALQEQFAAFVKQTDKSKVAIQKALDEAQLLFDSLMQKYFG